MKHFEAIAAASDLPIIAYNIPARVVVNIEPITISRLAEIDTIAGELIEFFEARGVQVIVLSEYGITPVDKAIRLNRLFHARSRRCFDVAIDHGFFNERGFLQGIENLESAVKTVVAAAPDAVQLTRHEVWLGLVMKAAQAKLAGKRVDGKALSERVRSKLT